MTIEQAIETLKKNGFIEEWTTYDAEDGPYDLVLRNSKGVELKDFLESISFKKTEEVKTGLRGVKQTWYTFFQDSPSDDFTIVYNSTAPGWFFNENKIPANN